VEVRHGGCYSWRALHKVPACFLTIMVQPISIRQILDEKAKYGTDEEKRVIEGSEQETTRKQGEISEKMK